MTAEVGELKLEMLPPPETKAQVPLPIVGVFAAKLVVVEQRVWSGPAFEVVGNGSTFILTISVEEGQEPFDTVNIKIFTPKLNPVTAEVGDDGFVGTPVPDTSVHNPVPTVGTFALKVVDEEQTN